MTKYNYAFIPLSQLKVLDRPKTFDSETFIGIIWSKDKIIRSWVGGNDMKAFLNDMKPHFDKMEKLERLPEKFLLKLPEGLSSLAIDVYKNLKKIKAGDLITYKELAEMCHKPHSSQAIGKIVGQNPLPYFIPCHRVVAKNGPGGFSANGGMETKKQMLLQEGYHLEHLQDAQRSIFDHGLRPKKIVKEFLNLAPEFKEIVKKSSFFTPSDQKPEAPYPSLSKAIIYQQLSTKAANCIYQRFLQSQGGAGQILKASWVHKCTLLDLKNLGVSSSKAQTLKILAQWELEGQMPTVKKIQDLPDHMIIRQLTQIKGIGRWTVEMYLIFGLGRLNVLSAGDLGLQKGYEKLYQIKIQSPLELFTKTTHYSPLRTLGTWYLWRGLEF